MEVSLEKRLRGYVLPNILAMMGMSCYILADTFFISQASGSVGITALNLTLPVYSLMFAIGSMIGMGFAIHYALDREGNPDRANTLFSHAVEWEILISLCFVTLGIMCPDMVLRLMGADAEILQVGTDYLRIVLCFAPCFLLNYTITAFVRNDYAPRIAMTATMASSLFNILFDYLFMFPLGLGMRGAALATGMAPMVSMLVCMAHYLSGSNHICFRFIKPSLRYLVNACQAGTSYCITELANGVTTTVFNYLLLGLGGNLAVAAYSIIANFSLVGIAIFNGIAQGEQPLLSECHGKGDMVGETRVLRHAQQIAIGIAIFLVAMMALFHSECVALFNSEHDESLASLAEVGIILYFLGFLFAAYTITYASFFGAIAEGGKAFLISMSRGVVFIVLVAIILSNMLGMMGVWLSFPISEMLTLAICIGLRKKTNGRQICGLDDRSTK